MAKKVSARLRELRTRLRRLWPDLGQRGENIAARELKRRGYRIKERRWRTRRGEIDIVAEDGETLVIVEVKTRRSTRVAQPVDAVDPRKQRKLVYLAEAYVKAKRLGDAPVRFDVVGVHLPTNGPKTVTVLKNAFHP